MVLKLSFEAWNSFIIIIDQNTQKPNPTNKMWPDIETLIAPHKHTSHALSVWKMYSVSIQNPQIAAQEARNVIIAINATARTTVYFSKLNPFHFQCTCILRIIEGGGHKMLANNCYRWHAWWRLYIRFRSTTTRYYLLLSLSCALLPIV